jgi:hypothetical protein
MPRYSDLGDGRAVAFTAGYGAGFHAVYAKLDDRGRVEKITIVFNNF